MAIKVGDAAGLLEREDEAEGQAEQVQAVESTPAPDDGDVGGAVAELRAQVAELDRIGSGLQEDMDAVLDLVSELVQGCEGMIGEQRKRDEMAARAVEARGKRTRQKAEDAVLDSVRQLTERHAKYLEERTKEATRMVERLGRVTLPDKVLRIVAFAVLVMLAALLGHLCWQAFLA